jgi:hypothetical protein
VLWILIPLTPRSMLGSVGPRDLDSFRSGQERPFALNRFLNVN